jgi:hypothetical protein
MFGLAQHPAEIPGYGMVSAQAAFELLANGSPLRRLIIDAAADCDMEHNIPHQRGGETDPDNNTPIDRRWHRAKTHADWTYVKNKDRSVTWTSPTGLTEIVYPHDYRLGP